MKTRIILIIYGVIALLGLLLLLSRDNVYVVAALALGVILLGHREIWSLIRHRRMPVIDERVRDNLSGAMRITGVFFFIASIVLLLLIRFDVFEDTPVELIISGELVIVGITYIIGYYYYDRVRPNLGKTGLRWLKICMLTAGFSLSTIALAIVLHNLISYLFNFEEAFFFILGLLAAPAILAISLLGSLGIYLKGLIVPANEGTIS